MSGVFEKKSPEIFLKSKKKYIFAIFLIVCIIGFTAKSLQNPRNATDVSITEVMPEYRNIKSTVEGSGVLEVTSKFSITSDTDGFIDEVAAQNVQLETGSPLFTIVSVNENQKYQSVRSSVSGIIVETYVSIGDYVTNNQDIVKVRDSNRLLVHAYFSPDFVQELSIGDPATVVVDWGNATVDGYVDSIANSNSIVENKIVREVTVLINNTGKITDKSDAKVTINQKKQIGNASLTYFVETVLKAQSEGIIVSVLKKGDVIAPDIIVATISNRITDYSVDSPNNRPSEEEGDKIRDGYVIEAPFAGELVECFASKGDYVSKGTALGTLANLDYLRLSIKADEYQISQIRAGQTAELVVYALPGQTYRGYVTYISKIGTITGGIASYSVLITVPKVDGLVPGMRIDATIETANKENVLSIPNEAITRDSTILVACGSPSALNATEQTAPTGYVYVPIVIGNSDEKYTEIVSGLSEKDVVAFIS